jgi:hypothetical protein
MLAIWKSPSHIQIFELSPLYVPSKIYPFLVKVCIVFIERRLVRARGLIWLQITLCLRIADKTAKFADKMSETADIRLQIADKSLKTADKITNFCLNII